MKRGAFLVGTVHHTASRRYIFDSIVQDSLLFIYLSHFAEIFERAVGFVTHVGIVELGVSHNLLVRENLRILAQCGAEAQPLDKGVVVEIDLRVAFHGGVEHVVVNGVGHSADTVQALIVLHQPRSFPRRVVADDDIGAV